MKIELVQIQRIIDWTKTKLYLDAISSKSSTRIVRRGEVYHCNFGYGIGSEIQKERPAVIIQNNPGNNHSGNTIVVPITHDHSTLPCATDITPQTDKTGTIILDGQANASNLMCVSKARLGDYICTLPRTDMEKIDTAIAKALDLMKYYSNLTKQLHDKLEYINRIKQERNQAQDKLQTINNSQVSIDKNS